MEQKQVLFRDQCLMVFFETNKEIGTTDEFGQSEFIGTTEIYEIQDEDGYVLEMSDEDIFEIKELIR